MKIQVHYFAILRERAGKRGEEWETEAKTADALYEELKAAYDFPLPVDRVRVAVGTVYEDIDVALTDGMEITFIPPVAGG